MIPKKGSIITAVSQVKIPRRAVLLILVSIILTSQEVFNNLKLTWLFGQGSVTSDPNTDAHIWSVYESWKYILPCSEPSTQEDFRCYLLCKTAHHQSPPTATYKDLHKCHRLNNPNMQN